MRDIRWTSVSVLLAWGWMALVTLLTAAFFLCFTLPCIPVGIFTGNLSTQQEIMLKIFLDENKINHERSFVSNYFSWELRFSASPANWNPSVLCVSDNPSDYIVYSKNNLKRCSYFKAFYCKLYYSSIKQNVLLVLKGTIL